MSCNLIIIDGKEVGITDEGTVSSLYKEATSKLGEEKGREVFLVSLSDDFKETIPPKEVYNPKKISEKYTRLITQIKESDPEQYWSVDIPSQEDIKSAAEEGRIVDVKGGMGLVTEDGNMIGLFKYDTNVKGTAEAVQKARVEKGGIKLDNFDGYLTRTYQKNGFRVAARIPFNEEYAPEGWNKEKHGNPDVVFMVYDPNGELDIKEKVFEDYDEAKDYRDSYVEQAKVGHPFYAVNPSTSSNYANLTEDGKGNFVFYHVGKEGYETIKPTSGSTTATSRVEAAALSKVGGVAMYYTSPTDSETMVSGDTRYAVKVPMEKVYDFNADPLNLIDEARELHEKEHPGKAFDANTQLAYITKLAGEKGYEMVVSDWNGRTRAQTTKEFSPVDIQKTTNNVVVKPFSKTYESNVQKGYIASKPKTKEESLQEVYMKIHNERNSKNKYDSLYHLYSNSSKLTQGEIASTILSSDISQELKYEYLDILNAPEQKRESFKVEEPSLESVMQYITSQNEVTEPMNDEQTKDFKNMLLSVKEFSVEKLKKAFYDENGIFLVSPKKLVASGLYSEYEAEHLAKDLELQTTVKEAIEALKNTDNVEDLISSEQDFDQVEKEDKFTSFGKLNSLNPHIVEKTIQETLAATTREEFDELIGELPFVEFQKSMQSEAEKDKLFEELQAYKKAEMLMDIEGEIKPSLKSNTEVVTAQVAKNLRGEKVLLDIKYFLQQDLSILKADPKNTRTLLSSIEKGLIAQGYDVIGLESKKPTVYLMEYLSAVTDLSEQPSRENLSEYARVYNEYFSQDLSPEKGFVKSEQDDREFVKLDTKLTEEEVYNQQGLIKQSEGLYIRVNKKTADELYPVLATYPEKLPEGVTNEEQLRKYIQSNVKNNEVTNMDTAEEIDLFKMYFSIPLEAVAVKEDVSGFNTKQAQFTGDMNYLTTDFISDFYVESLKAKAAESQEYRDFYRHFKVTENGLELINNDPITLDTIKPYVTEDLQNYSLISKSMPNLKDEAVDIVESRNSRRNVVTNYPSTITKFDGNISIVDKSHVIGKNTNDEFIKLGKDIYENTETVGNLAMFTKIEPSESNFLNFSVAKPTAEWLLSDYLHLENKPEKFISAKNYLSNEEKDGLADNEFSCV